MALEAGADGYLLKRTKPADLRNALLDVLGGGASDDQPDCPSRHESFRRKAKNRDESAHLSMREEQIVRLLSQGYANKAIADRLEISIDTVCSHLKRVFEKLHVSSRTEAVVRYMASKASPTKSPGRRLVLGVIRYPVAKSGALFFFFQTGYGLPVYRKTRPQDPPFCFQRRVATVADNWSPPVIARR